MAFPLWLGAQPHRERLIQRDERFVQNEQRGIDRKRSRQRHAPRQAQG